MMKDAIIKDENKYPLHIFFVYILIIITLTLIIFRILITLFEFPYLIELSKDYDYGLLMRGMENGLINFYEPIPGALWPPYYLYFWFFLFFSMFLIPIEIGLYIWDIIRLFMCIYVVKTAPKVFENKKDLLVFYFLITIGYCIDAYYNNVNFLILFLLFNSIGELNSLKF